MRRILWIGGVLAGTMLAGTGCARQGVKEDQALLGRLPMDDKQEVYTAQHNVEVAQANKVLAERARQDSRAYRDIAAKELDAARAKLSASQKAVELGHRADSAEMVRAAERNAAVAEKELVAEKAKKDFADRLIDLRDREAELSSRQLDEAQVELSLVRTSALRRSGIAPREDIATLMRERDDKLQDIAQIEERISLLRNQTAQLKMGWQQRMRSFEVASRDSSLPAIVPPREPRKLRPERLSPEAVTPRDRERVRDRELMEPDSF